MDILTFCSAVLLGLIHVVGYKLYFLNKVPRSWWLSFAGGVSIAYVFLYLLPEIHTDADAALEDGFIKWLERRTNLVALAGLTCYYTIEQLVRCTNKRAENSDPEKQPSIYWLHIASFAVYVMAVGYLLRLESYTILSLILFTFALMLHFVVTDFGLRRLYKQVYDRSGRWVLAAAPILGWILGWFSVLPESFLSLLLAFIAGGIILNALKEELPEERESRIIPFLIGVLFYSTILLLIV